MNVNSKQDKIEWRLITILTNSIQEMAKPDCDECGGEGTQFYQTAVDDGYDVPCEKCFPNMTWEDLLVDPDSEWDDRD